MISGAEIDATRPQPTTPFRSQLAPKKGPRLATGRNKQRKLAKQIRNSIALRRCRQFRAPENTFALGPFWFICQEFGPPLYFTHAREIAPRKRLTSSASAKIPPRAHTPPPPTNPHATRWGLEDAESLHFSEVFLLYFPGNRFGRWRRAGVGSLSIGRSVSKCWAA